MSKYLLIFFAGCFVLGPLQASAGLGAPDRIYTGQCPDNDLDVPSFGSCDPLRFGDLIKPGSGICMDGGCFGLAKVGELTPNDRRDNYLLAMTCMNNKTKKFDACKKIDDLFPSKQELQKKLGTGSTGVL